MGSDSVVLDLNEMATKGRQAAEQVFVLLDSKSLRISETLCLKSDNVLVQAVNFEHFVILV